MLKMFIVRLEDLKSVPHNAALKVEWDRQAAERAAKSAGLVEQAANAITEIDNINALANYVANFLTKVYAVTDEWHKAARHSVKFDSINRIWEREFLTGEFLTVGEYLNLVKEIKSNNAKIT